MDSTSADLLETVEFATGSQPSWTVLVLHGLGDSGDGWAPIAPELVRPTWPEVRFVFPHAPVRPVTINGGMRMRAWFDILDLADIDAWVDEAGIAQSAAAVEALIAREAERGVPRSRVVLAGFSQGGAIALTVALRSRDVLAGLVALSSYLPQGAALVRDATPMPQTPPVFMAHGLHDPVLPHRAGELAAVQLRAAGYTVEWHSYPMAHEVCLEEIAVLGDWLSQRFAGR
jgi:phospholipase/carboxylesterase